ncbi:SubName: Full=Uncharacterized protein {ECO:0000313/EMBL:CCA74534.1} [Serendipita indica DSM 11827]|uniref:Uncharacterized protein n=1 Tax=Serendipita indica (strain DSM 11827) TaxID=1109443 RepID=G4TT91_SERID|nr:SubName: Full=Uncharacterized protein {ECO:0000313/EMBL:CCA74534.1} [Serendipita indica DSM 11827]CCA74534.1 hypothetical protein PIIN_08486 [Serendipita indica DSM 11827]
MALGNARRADESPILIAVSAVAVAIVLVLLGLLVALRARHIALRQLEADRLRYEYENKLALRFTDKPALFNIWMAPPCDSRDQENEARSQKEWNAIMPLLVARPEPSERGIMSSEASVGVLIHLPDRHRPARRASRPSLEHMNGFSELDVVFGLATPVIVGRPP